MMSLKNHKRVLLKSLVSFGEISRKFLGKDTEEF